MPDAGPPVTVLDDGRFVSSRGSAVFAEGRVETLTYERESGAGSARALALQFPRPGSGLGTLVVSAPEVSGEAFEERVVGQGGVRVRAARGDTAATEVVSYDGRKGEAFGDQPVKILAAKATLTSPGFHWRASDDALDLGPAQLDMRGRAP